MRRKTLFSDLLYIVAGGAYKVKEISMTFYLNIIIYALKSAFTITPTRGCTRICMGILPLRGANPAACRFLVSRSDQLWQREPLRFMHKSRKTVSADSFLPIFFAYSF